MKTVIENLKGSIYQNPLHWNECYYKGWEISEEYISGNLMHKLAIAQAANEEYPGIFENNIKALKEVISPDIESDQIYISLGSPWVPTDVIDDFILHLIGIEKVNDEYPKEAAPFLQAKYAVRRDDFTGIWEIPEKTRFRKSHEHGKYEEYNYSIHGTSRMDMLYLLENILNMKTLAIYDTPDPKSKIRILNQKETVKILEKQDKMIEDFKSWVWSDPKREARLRGAYCRRYGNIKKRVFDGSFLEFPNMNPEIKLKKHQKDSVARIIFSPNTLLAHDVGAGKTYTMIAAGMELRRLGKSKKNLYVIPNNILPQWVEMFRHMYKDANLLIVDNKNFCFKKRSKTLERIMNEDFDAILMAYSCFDMLSLSKKYYTEFYKERLKMIDKASTNFYSKADIDRKRASVLKIMEKLQDDMTSNVCEIPFDALGINTLFVDEAHNYKNVPLQSGIVRVKGFNKTGSKKCEGMMDKVHCIQRQNNGGRVIMATGTPITNSITDIFVLQKFLQDGELEFLGIQNFDSWVGMYAKKVTEFEIDVDTNSYHLATRFSRFHNVPELTAIFSSVADFYHIDNKLGIPELDGYTDSVREGGENFKDFLKDISRRADDVRNNRVDKKIDNLLKITTDGRKAALDMRLIDMIYGLDFDSKVVRCAEAIMDIYERTRGEKLIQMVFCDVSTPKASFNIYDELKSLLKTMGMPENEIAFIHDADSEAKKKMLFRDLQDGMISVVIGSTFKMGLGVNVQKRLCALHHLDVPWRPADMVQREGRILRQGNECENVEIHRYITKGSFDAYSWQLLESKQKFISQILSGHVTVREGEDVDETVLNYAEVKALAVGNPLIKERVELINELDKYKILHRDYMEERLKKRRILEELPEKIEKQRLRIENTKKDIAFYAENKTNYKDMEYEEQKAIRDTIYTAVKTHVNMPFERKVLTYQGFDVVVPARMKPKNPNAKDMSEPESPKDLIPYVYVKRSGAYYMEIESLSGITKRLNNLLENLDRIVVNQEKELERLIFQKETLQSELATESKSFQDEIDQLTAKIEKIDEELGLKTT
jgi:N12 class adenine-specific DNA methylase